MIYSQWQPEGGYRYYEVAGGHPIGDDFKVQLPAPIKDIGVPSHDVGQRLPPNARYAGEGEIPRGVITPMSRKNLPLSGTSPITEMNPTVLVALGIGAFLVLAVHVVRNKR